MNLRHTIIDSPLDGLTVVANEENALVGIYFKGHLRKPDDTLLGPRSAEGFDEIARQLGEYFDGERTEFDLPLAPHGTAFERRVWHLLTKIPHGGTRTYGDLARDLGDPKAAQAVGTANGRNPISVVVPCHRVIGANGSLTGYAGGLSRKRFLLSLEEPAAAAAGRLF